MMGVRDGNISLAPPIGLIGIFVSIKEGAIAMNKRGFAALSPERRREIASAGGRAAQASGAAHRWTAEEARAAGVLGGQAISGDRAHMAEIGRKGGEMVSGDREHMRRIGAQGGRAAHESPVTSAEESA